MVEIFHDNFQNFKRYHIPKAQLVIADIPYNLGVKAYGSNPTWYVGGTEKTERARTQNQRFLMAMGNSIWQNTCIFVTIC